MADRYASFVELATHERAGIDFAIHLIERPSPVVILAPHGGAIEPGTSGSAVAIAAGCHSLYCFNGLRKGRPHGDLHITSTRFDEPSCLDLVARSSVVVAIHGCMDTDPDAAVFVGGLNVALRNAIAAALAVAGFPAAGTGHRFPADNPANICNRGISRRGVQIEIPRPLRDTLRTDSAILASFADTISAVLTAE